MTTRRTPFQSQKRRIGIGFLIFMGWTLAAPRDVQADPLGAGGGAIFRMSPSSSFEEGCFPPCMCPILIRQPLLGTFQLTYVGAAADGIQHYAVDDVNWLASAYDPEFRIVGSGKYSVGSPGVLTVLQHRMELDLRVGDDPVEHYDSGWVDVNSNAGINITVSINGMFCYDRAITIDASRVPDDQITPYALSGGATFQRGCWDPCDCPLEEPRPMIGTFALVPLQNDSLFAQYGVVAVRWHVLSTNAANTLPIRGAGFYMVGGEFAAQHRMMLDLQVGDEARQHFDSGLIVGGAGFPQLDVVVSIHGMVCFDTVLHILAGPEGGQMCGGFAGIPCDDPGEYCKLPIGDCCCDFQGVCTPIPLGCPDVWDPVCGCNGVTYSNECDAAAASQSTNHLGPCESACCLPDGGCLDFKAEECAAKGGIFHPGAICSNTICSTKPKGACCLPNAAGTVGCMIATPQACAEGGGEYQGDGSECPTDATVPCPPTPCNVACPNNSTCFAGCGTLLQGAECILFQADGGGVYQLDDLGGISVGDRAYVTGCLSSCFSVCNQQNGCILQNTISPCGQVCGGFAGIPCDNPDKFCKLPTGACCCDFQGVCTPMPEACFTLWDPVCGCDGVTYGNECEADLAGVSIAHRGECRAGCGGPNQPPCPDGFFCKVPVGSCDLTSAQGGRCAPRPNACPEIWDPVCGCDGRTYGNECEADRAGVNIAYFGPCESNQCLAQRFLTGPSIGDFTYCPSIEKPIIIALSPPVGASAVALEDSPPPGWAVANISHDGSFDAVNQKVKWGPFFPPFPGNVSYSVLPANDSLDIKCFSGTISVDGANEAICGDQCLFPCCPNTPADTPQADCATCSIGDCSSCSNGACNDGQVSLCEVIGYACAWMRGCNDDLAGMTRAAFIWRNGECYCWDDPSRNWHPTVCNDSASLCCPASPGPGSEGAISAGKVSGELASATISAIAASRTSRGGALEVSISIEAPAGASAAALEMVVPRQWKVLSISDGGALDEANQKVKWGPFFDRISRTVTFTVQALRGRSAEKSDRLTQSDGVEQQLEGTASFDGVNRPIRLSR